MVSGTEKNNQGGSSINVGGEDCALLTTNRKATL